MSRKDNIYILILIIICTIFYLWMKYDVDLQSYDRTELNKRKIFIGLSMLLLGLIYGNLQGYINKKNKKDDDNKKD